MSSLPQLELRFRGQHEHTIDRKGRIAISVKFRKVIIEKYEGQPLMITKKEKCLVVYPFPEWAAIEERALGYHETDVAVVAYFRSHIASAGECPMDRQGRILIPPPLRAAARLEREVMLLGMLKSFEIWDKARFLEEDQKNTADFTQLMSKLPRP